MEDKDFPTADELQSLFPDFEIGEKVGSGTYKSVYKVTNRNTEKNFALKILHPENIDMARLYREIQAMKNITSPYIANFIKFESEVSETRTITYLIEEFIEGETLETILDRHRILSVDEGVILLKQLLEGLDACWAKRVVHRDIKPANIMIRPNNKPVIVDFGLSRHLEMESLTPTSFPGLIGTPMFAAPEILKYSKKDINASTDLYSLGITAFMMFTGEHPYLDEPDYRDYETAIDKLLNGQAKNPLEINSLIPPKLSQLLLRLIAREPIDRYRNPAIALNKLEGIN